ncbi:hypothetical protein BKA57DRAFT_478412 [Linnemannia elongata]|nr:hypothetical protein BKA57DRAFT_478412 [Linnemannia elongata]
MRSSWVCWESGPPRHSLALTLTLAVLSLSLSLLPRTKSSLQAVNSFRVHLLCRLSTISRSSPSILLFPPIEHTRSEPRKQLSPRVLTCQSNSSRYIFGE